MWPDPETWGHTALAACNCVLGNEEEPACDTIMLTVPLQQNFANQMCQQHTLLLGCQLYKWLAMCVASSIGYRV